VKSLPIEILRYEFHFPHLSTVLVVEVRGDEAIIHASRDSFSAQRKSSFIRELAAEGFIADEHRWYALDSYHSGHSGITWTVDQSWLRIDERALASTRSSMMKLVLVGTALLALMMGLLFTDNLGNVRVRPAPFFQRATREAHAAANNST
jgi:hypothetical protein